MRIPHQPLQDIVDGAVATAGEDSVISGLDRLARLSSGFSRPAGRQDLGFNSGTAQLVGGSFHLLDATVPPESRERVVDQQCALHETQLRSSGAAKPCSLYAC